jgi:predicted RecA/RadA family phage recombinase
MKNFVQPGDNITLDAPADVLSGAGVIIGSLFGVANGDALTGKPVVLSTVGVFDLPKKTADDLTIGEAVYWDDTNAQVTETTTGNTKIGAAIAAAGAGAITVTVRLNGAF